MKRPDLNKILKSAENHARDHDVDGPRYQVGDLEEALRLAWKHLGTEQREQVLREFEDFVGFWD